MLPGSVGDRAENILGTVLKNQRFNYKLPARIPQTMLGPGKASRPRGSLCSFGSSVGLESPTIHCKTGSLYPEPIPNSLYSKSRERPVASFQQQSGHRGMEATAMEQWMEEEMATHLSILAWRIPRTEEPGGLQSMGPTWLVSNFLVRPASS